MILNNEIMGLWAQILWARSAWNASKTKLWIYQIDSRMEQRTADLKKPVRQNEMKSEVSHRKFAFELFFWIQNLVGQHLVDGLHIKFFFINV